MMSLLQTIPLEKLTPARLWSALDPETRRSAARCLYDPGWDDASSRAEADVAIARALRFRPAAVRRLPMDKRIEYVVRAVRPDDSLATALLRALHIADRKSMLGLFLDELGIPQRDGVIDTERDLEPPEASAVGSAVSALRAQFPEGDVDLYLASLLAMDPAFWSGVADYVRSG